MIETRNGQTKARIGGAQKLTVDPVAASGAGAALSIRASGHNVNHHLWQNGGHWWLAYTVHLPDYTKRRIRQSLRTKDLTIARQRRDVLFVQYAMKAENASRPERISIPVSSFRVRRFALPIRPISPADAVANSGQPVWNLRFEHKGLRDE